MARPRKYVIADGHEVTGVSRHHDGRYHVIIGGKRVYFRELKQARVAYREGIPPMAITEVTPAGAAAPSPTGPTLRNPPF